MTRSTLLRACSAFWFTLPLGGGGCGWDRLVKLFDQHPFTLVLPEPVVELSQADAQVRGGAGAVAVVLLQRRQNVPALDFFQRGRRVAGTLGDGFFRRDVLIGRRQRRQ